MKHLFLILLAAISFRSHAQTLPSIKIKLQLVAEDLTSPVGLMAPADGSSRLFVLEQSGKIKIIRNGVVLPVPFLTLTDKLDGLNIAYSEKGLLGFAFHPDYKSNGRFFVYYSAPYNSSGFDHKSIIAEYKVSATNPDVADVIETIIMEIPQPESNHNGGCMEFGPDGYLYIGLGDGGGAGDQHGTTGNAQDLNSLLGKILRIDVDAERPYKIPPGNPLANTNDVKKEIFAYGLRNPWRFSFDRANGKIFCADVGQNKWEEIDIIEKGKNYGWRLMEGNHCYNPETGCETKNFALPIYEYDHKTGISICGGYVYRGKSFPSLTDKYIFGDWSGKLFYLEQVSDRSWKRGDLIEEGKKSNDTGMKINSMGSDEQGEIYLVTQHSFGPKSKSGAVYRVAF
ncbi:PQQ-dependent sugar dehydrogenase [soil metagenome]